MALILDTNALSALADGDLVLRRAIEDEPDYAVPVVVLGEFLFGIRRSRHRRRYELWLETLLPQLEILSLGAETASYYAQVRSELTDAGRPLPANDLWIAALARQHAMALVTRDKHFQAVQRLQIVSW